MSIAVNVVMQGDLDNPKHREVCNEIAEAIRVTIAKHVSMPGYLAMTETKQAAQETKQFTVDGKEAFLPKSVHVEHKLQLYTGFHLNP